MQRTHNSLILGSNPSGPTTLLFRLDIVRYKNRNIGQPGRPLALRARCRKFDSLIPLQIYREMYERND